jgi:iron donor protein CyaY
MMDEQQFRQRCDRAFEKAERALAPAAERHGFEIENANGTLTLEFEDPEPARFVASPQTPVRQIWLSALSRSFRLPWSDQAEDFILDGQNLTQLLARLAGEHLGATVTV